MSGVKSCRDKSGGGRQAYCEPCVMTNLKTPNSRVRLASSRRAMAFAAAAQGRWYRER